MNEQKPQQHQTGSVDVSSTDVTTQQLLKILVESQRQTAEFQKQLVSTQQELAESQKALADAILEARKPYVDPKVLEQKKRDLEERQRQIAADQRERVARKRICPHMRENGTYNIKWMSHSNGITLGVCGTCFSQFDTRNPEDLALLRKDLKSIKNMGRAGEHARRGILVEA